MGDDTLTRAAERAADALLVNGLNERGTRLVIMDAAKRDLGGWCRDAIVSQVRFALLAALEAPGGQREG